MSGTKSRRSALDVFEETQRIRREGSNSSFDKEVLDSLEAQDDDDDDDKVIDDESKDISQEAEQSNDAFNEVAAQFSFYDQPKPEEDSDYVHDQLPSVEEAKANLSMQTPTSSSNVHSKYFKLIVATLGLTLIIVSIVAITKSKKSEPVFVPTGRGEEVIEFLFDLEVSRLPAMKDPKFPQHKAAMFVADGDMYQMDYTSSPVAARKFVERYALAVIYYHYNGPQWNYKLNFLSAQDHCNWWETYETATSGKTVRMGVECDDDGFVKKLNLAQNNLGGTGVPHEVQSLTELESLHLYFNTIGGEFPEAVRNMKNLKSLALMQNGIVGTIPDWIGEMTQLTTLALGKNKMHGEVPQSISKLRNLQVLGLDDNDGFTGQMDLFKGMSAIKALYLENNAFTGQLPANPNQWPNLRELDVSNNMIDMELPSALINHKHLNILDVNKNLLTGTFPDDIFENTNLELLAIHNNGIYGTIPDRIAFLKNLKHVDFSWNRLTGIIPDDVSQLTQLRYWATTNNDFREQRIPDFSRMTNLMDLSMKHNNLVGTIPDWIGGLSILQMLDLDANGLSGGIPTWMGLLTELNHLLLNRNMLTGTIPRQLVNLRQLDVLLLDGNSIHGNADAICNSNNIKPTYFTSDCYPGPNGERPEIECRCCTTCCLDSDTSCNNRQWSSNVDPSWEYGYLRPNYVFNLANAPGAYSKEGDSSPVDPIDGAFDSVEDGGN